MFHDFKQRFERAISKVTQEADAALSKVTQEADAAIHKVSLEADAALIKVHEGADAAITRMQDSGGKDSKDVYEAFHYCHCIHEASPASVECAQDIFANLFDQNNQLNKQYIHAKLDKLSLNDNILLVEDKDHYNLLHKAVIFNSKDLLDILIEHKFDVSRNITRVHCNVSRRCAHYNLGTLHLACYLGHEEIVKTLLNAGADPQQDARIYTSALVNCPAHLQPRVLVCNTCSNDVTIAARCGNREPVFFAVLGDHVQIVELFLETTFPGVHSSQGSSQGAGSNRRPVSQYNNLLQLACRSGSEECIRYLLAKYPGTVNRADSDGLPPLVLVMRHKTGLYLAQLLLQAGADVHLLDNLWNKGNNVLHLLYTSGLWIDDRTALSSVSRLCLEQGVDVNAEDQHGHRPLHHLLEQLNGFPIPPRFDPKWPQSTGPHSVQQLSAEVMEKGPGYLEDADHDLLLCIKELIEYGSCIDGELAYLNTNCIIRYCQAVLARRCEDTDLAEVLARKRYGLDNLLTVANWMIQNSSRKYDYCFSMLVKFVGSVLCPSTGVPLTVSAGIIHHYKLLEDPAILSGFMDLLEMILPYCNPTQLNSLIIQQLPPLLFILSKIAEAPAYDNYAISATTAEALSNLLRLLLEYGCSPQIEIETRHGSPRMMGGFDMLMQMLESIQELTRSRGAPNPIEGIRQKLGYPGPLTSLCILTELLLQYGARPVVFRKLLYGSSAAEAPWCYSTPSHSFLFQLLQFGMQNLHLTSGSDYARLFLVLCNQAEGSVLQFVLATVHGHFTETHAGTNNDDGVEEDVAQRDLVRGFIGLLEGLLHQCRSLKQLCRQSILRSVPHYNPRLLGTLPLPLALRTYLTDFTE